MLRPKKVKFKYLFQESYLAYIKNSIGTKMFRNFYVRKSGKAVDVLRNGDLSCAIYASTILRHFSLIRKPHFTVAKTVDDLLQSGAKKVPTTHLKPGDVLVWRPKQSKSGLHNHIGFYIGGRKAISNSNKKRMIAKHHYTFNGQRGIEFALRPNWRSHAQS